MNCNNLKREIFSAGSVECAAWAKCSNCAASDHGFWLRTRLRIFRFHSIKFLKKLKKNPKFFSKIHNCFQIKGVTLGEWDLSTEVDCEQDHCSDPVLNVPVIERIVHKGYLPFSRSQENDIALLRLNQTVKFTSWIKPICLPNISTLRDIDYGSNYTLIASGWGQVCFLAIQYFLL